MSKDPAATPNLAASPEKARREKRTRGRITGCSQVRVRAQVVAGLALPELVALVHLLPRRGDGRREKKGARGGEHEEAPHLRVDP
jgi:hypothetical protein